MRASVMRVRVRVRACVCVCVPAEPKLALTVQSICKILCHLAPGGREAKRFLLGQVPVHTVVLVRTVDRRVF
jgi:hypothetical protein